MKMKLEQNRKLLKTKTKNAKQKKRTVEKVKFGKMCSSCIWPTALPLSVSAGSRSWISVTHHSWIGLDVRLFRPTVNACSVYVEIWWWESVTDLHKGTSCI